MAGQGALAAKKDKGKAARAQNRLADLRSKLETAKKTLEEKKAAAATAALKAEAAAAEKKAKKEISDPTTDSFLLYFVESVLTFQSKFDNSSDTTKKVWEHIHYDAAKKIAAGDFAHSDLRSVDVYKKIYATIAYKQAATLKVAPIGHVIRHELTPAVSSRRVRF